MDGQILTAPGFTFREVMDPIIPPHGHVDVTVSDELLNQVKAVSDWKFWNVHAAGSVLRAPECIIFGARLDASSKPQCWCYTGLPTFVRAIGGGYEIRPAGYVYVAYVDQQLRLYEWGLERAAADRPYLPHDYAERFPGGISWIKQN